MSWPFDQTEPHVTPERFLEYYCRREGVTREQLRLPSMLVATLYVAALTRATDATKLAA